MNTYRAAIVGLSWIGSDPAGAASHPVLGTATPYSHASALAAHPGVTVVAGCDISAEACTAFQQKWQHLWPEVRTYADYREMLMQEKVDILSVVTPDHLHTGVVMAALEAGVRGIFCEKPLATNLEEADQMIRMVREHGVVMTVNHTRRWGPEFVTAREKIRQGVIGTVSHVIARFGGQRAMLFRNHTHVLDMLSYFAESDPEWVMAELEPGLGDYGIAYRGDGGRDPSLEPGANAYVAYKNGVRGFFSGMKGGFDELAVQIVGEKGRVDVSDAGLSVTTRTPAGIVTQQVRPSWTQGGMEAAVADLIHALETGEPTQSEPAEARKAVAITRAILESQAGGNISVRVK